MKHISSVVSEAVIKLALLRLIPEGHPELPDTGLPEDQDDDDESETTEED